MYTYRSKVKPWDTVGIRLNGDHFNTLVVKDLGETLLVQSKDKKKLLLVDRSSIFKPSNSDDSMI